jgi:hypothetical protein
MFIIPYVELSKGNLSAVDVGKSVSRVGGKTQLRAYRAVAGDLRLSRIDWVQSFLAPTKERPGPYCRRFLKMRDNR